MIPFFLSILDNIFLLKHYNKRQIHSSSLYILNNSLTFQNIFGTKTVLYKNKKTFQTFQTRNDPFLSFYLRGSFTIARLEVRY